MKNGLNTEDEKRTPLLPLNNKDIDIRMSVELSMYDVP